MAKTKTPLFSLGSRGTIGKTLTTQKRGSETLIREKPIPTDPETDPQLWHRHVYLVACQYWNGLTPAQKQAWRAVGVRRHITGFNAFTSYHLKQLSLLRLYMPFIEGSGSAVKDFSDNLNHGTVVGASWTTGKFDKALSFDGLNDYVSIGNKTWLFDAITVECWLYPPSGAVGYPHFLIFKRSPPLYWALEHHAAGRFLWACLGADNTVYYLYMDGVITLDAWNHLAVTMIGNLVTLFVNGVSVSSATFTTNINEHTTLGPVYLGVDMNLDYDLKGILDEPMVFTSGLPEADILIHANRKETP